MSIKLGIVMDPIDDINYKKDSSLAMLWAAQQKGWELFYMEQSDLYSRDGDVRARMAPISVDMNPNKWFEREAYQDLSLTELDVILMRKDPPFDNEFIYTTHLLAVAEAAGVLIVNRTQSLRDFNEKLFATHFPQCCPPVLVSRSEERLKAFHAEHKDVIFKPLDGMGGSSIYRIKEDGLNLGVVIETLTKFGQETIMAQRYIPEIVEGDKRILMINGEPIDYALARIPSQGETRGNLAAGGRGEGRPLSERDRWIAAQVGPKLREAGLLFVGLDVIGDYLTEINVTSPTCIRELNDQFGLDIGMQLMDCIEEQLAQQ
ncbi:Glutathione synthetase [Marinobacterium sp. xm-a-121]|jgi:glutathione synthase|uniref:glutathione synthase n=1 Tax=unclassified Marinobacterium TaxID=2644139 RepID=UPI001567FA59|nr:MULTISPECIES: glutathione synthase [unclassified Marinobacterium]NRP35908.1 Glutathione synthetase [Marinobacterium sp. xm-d-579]NRP39332.1 Glutathione synthetase [Marinobacterium sp. xm-a-121]NRP47668.1 Glutathione synthetase [Marinobacterium sp. xm-d-543]NRP59789.1 Glutathione synthetase [Marinobacterium sp. xm-d-564]NRP96130.1 Glutathione synthetase [Marinobacterium sp. xm-g-59]